jgi:predicted MFS family arabinose efflux permease
LATSGIALSNLGSLLASSLGAVVGGVVLANWSVAPAFFLVTVTWLVAAGLLVASPSRRSPTPVLREVSLRKTVRLLLRSHSIAAISTFVVLAEVLGFSSAALVPTFARDILMVDAVGLGVLVALRSLGGVLGLAWLATIGSSHRAGRLLLSVGAVFGAALVAFSLSSSFAVSAVVMFVSGAAAAVLDTLGQTLLQRAAPDGERGAAMGVWVFSIGFGPVGFLVLGAAASTYGAPSVQLASGLALLAAVSVMAKFTSLASAR